jgi:hypothetical protein
VHIVYILDSYPNGILFFSFFALRSQQRGNQVIGDGILQKTTNNEIHTFRPFSNHDSGAVTMVHQMLVYWTSHSGGAPQAFGKVVTSHRMKCLDK